MTGSCDPKITEALLDYAQGALDAATRREVARHLEQCPECRMRMREAVMYHNLFASVEKSVWGEKGPCPEPGELSLLSETPALLPPERMEFIKKHLSECVRCGGEFRRLAGITKKMRVPDFVKAYPVPDRLMARIGRVVGERVRTGAAAGDPAVIVLDEAPAYAAAAAIETAGRAAPPGQDRVPVFRGPITGALLSPAGAPLRGEWVLLMRNQASLFRIRSGRLGEFGFAGLIQGFYEVAARDARRLVIFHAGGAGP